MTEWSTYQQDIFTHVAEAKHVSAIVEAVAGSGKTTTLVQALQHVPFDELALFLAFNKRIADELRSRVPSDVDARTFNSLGFQAVRKQMKVEMDANKMKKFVQQNANDKLKEEAFSPIMQLIGSGKSSGAGFIIPNNRSVYEEIADQHDITLPEGMEHQVFQLVQQAIDWSYRETKTIDFDDQILYPLYFGLDMPKYNCVFVDEAQDLSPLQHEFLASLLHDPDRSRVIAVGDTRQAIYGFRGADSNSMTNLEHRFSMKQLPLSITYRCPLSVVRLAQQIAPELEPYERAIEGAVNHHDVLPPLENFTPQDLVLCRTNAPLLKLAMSFLKRRFAVYVWGDFGNKMIRFIKSFKAQNIDDFWQKLADWREQEISDAEQKEQWSRIGRTEDKYESITVVGEKAQTPEAICERFERLFSPSEGVSLATIHKSKGTEADNVYLLEPGLIPSRYATQPWMKEQENNLLYVAYTRAKTTFNFLPDGGIE